MTTYNTGNAVGSTDPRDLFDNAQNLDELVNSATKTSLSDRLGTTRKTWKGIEDDFDAFLLSSGYQLLGDYAAGVTFTAYNQIVRTAGDSNDPGEFWRPAANTELPYTTTGAGVDEGGALVTVGDANLRQELASTASGKGAAMIGTTGGGTVQDALDAYEADAGNGSGRNFCVNPSYNAIADDLNACTVSGGGNTSNKNLIGYVSGVEQTGSGCDYSGIYGGYDNEIQDGVMQHCFGAHHRITGGDHNTIAGGATNTISSGAYGFIGGGGSNTISSAGTGAAIIASQSSTVSGAAAGGVVLGGSGQTCSGSFAACLGGTGNTASANGAIATGRTNTVSGADSFSAGLTNTCSAPYSVTFGLSNTVSGSGYGFAAGRSNTVSGQYSGAIGQDNTVSAQWSSASGRHASATRNFSHVIGAERFSANGDAQTTVLALRRQTTNATPTALRLGASTARVTIPSDSSVAFECLIVGRRTDADNESAGYRVTGVIDNNAGTTALVGVPVVTVLAEDTAAWDVTVAADDANDALEISVTGEASKTINWVGRLTLAEVTG